MPRSPGSDRLLPKAASLWFRITPTAADLIARRAFEGECQAVTAARLIRWAIADHVPAAMSGKGGDVPIEVGIEAPEYLRIQQLAQASGRSEAITAKDILYAMLIEEDRLTGSREPITEADMLLSIIDQHQCDPDFGLWLHPLALKLRDRCSAVKLREWLGELRDQGEIQLISSISTDPPMITAPLPDGRSRAFSRLKRLHS
jgi:hypothetical protein